MKEIKNILIAGGGMMGKNIAFVFTKNPAYQVGVYDMKEVDVAAGIRQNTAELVAKGVLDSAELEERLSRVSFTTDKASPLLSRADLVVEAVFEDMDVKRQTFAMLEERCREDTIFCTNSSVMSPSLISRDLRRRDRFVGTHFWNPGHLIPLVEVVKSDATSDETAQTVMEVLAGVGKEPVLCKKDVPGFIANRMQHALWREAISIVENGIADAETVDKAVKYSFGLRLPQLGPLENAD
ncbi:MAG: 3-hydroxyacyl-CoA dehydrogenase family protein, partial [Bacteroidales bacterium]|nr:3-hydroxyacyl-CoA dehydrogenase family protein [Bacteroidales bacterium]